MQKSDLISRGPLNQILGHDETGEILNEGKFGGVLARAGIGKSSFLVQSALPSLLSNKKILHVSLNDSVDKVIIRYKEGLQNLSEKGSDFDATKMNRIWESIHPNIFGLHFTQELFSAANLADQIKSLKKDDIFIPEVLIIDGLGFDVPAEDTLKEIQDICKQYGFRAWFSIGTHREEELSSDGTPRQFASISEMFDAAAWIQAKDGKVFATAIKGGKTGTEFTLDPASLLVTA